MEVIEATGVVLKLDKMQLLCRGCWLLCHLCADWLTQRCTGALSISTDSAMPSNLSHLLVTWEIRYAGSGELLNLTLGEGIWATSCPAIVYDGWPLKASKMIDLDLQVHPHKPLWLCFRYLSVYVLGRLTTILHVDKSQVLSPLHLHGLLSYMNVWYITWWHAMFMLPIT